jgi:hypothetical protein
MQRSQDRVAQLEGQVRQLSRALTQATGRINEKKKSVDLLGGATNALIGTFARLAGPAAALSAGVQGMNDVRDATNRATTSIREQIDAARQLVQVHDSPAALQKTLLEDELIALETGLDVKQVHFARQTALSLEGLGADATRTLAKTRLWTKSDEEVQKLAMAVGKFRDPLAYGPGVGTPEQMLSAFIAAGKPSPVPIPEIPAATQKVLADLISIGTGPDEALALMSVLSAGFDSPEETATIIRALGSAVGGAGYGGGGLLRGIEWWQGADLTGQKTAAQKKAGPLADAIAAEKKVRAGMAVLTPENIARIRQREAEIFTARQTGGALAEMYQTMQIPVLTADEELRRATIAAQLENEAMYAHAGMKMLAAQQIDDALLTRAQRLGLPYDSPVAGPIFAKAAPGILRQMHSWTDWGIGGLFGPDAVVGFRDWVRGYSLDEAAANLTALQKTEKGREIRLLEQIAKNGQKLELRNPRADDGERK